MMVPGSIELDGLGVRFGGRPILQGLTARLSGRAIGLWDLTAPARRR